MAIHSQRHGVCVCVAKGKTILFHRGGGGGFSFLPGPHAQLENHKTAGGRGGGRGCRRKQSTKPRRWEKGVPQKQRDIILFHRGGGENTP